MTIMITVLAVLVWAATWLAIVKRLDKKTNRPLSTRLLNTLWLASLIIHGATLILPWLEAGTISIHLLGSFSIVMWLTGFLLFLTHLSRPLETMGLLVIPITILSLIMANFLPTPSGTIALQSGLGLHIILSLLAYSMLALATLQASKMAKNLYKKLGFSGEFLVQSYKS